MVLTLEEKNREYQAYIGGKKMEVLRIRIPLDSTLTFKNVWDYRATLTEVSFKTTHPGEVLTRKSSYLVIDEIDLNPVTTTKVYKIKVLRQNGERKDNTSRNN